MSDPIIQDAVSWAIQERLNLARTLKEKASVIDEHYVSKETGVPVQVVKEFQRTGRVPRNWVTHLGAIRRLFDEREKHLSLAKQHDDDVIRRDYHVSREQLRSIKQRRS